VNPKEHCNAIITRSGNVYERREEEKNSGENKDAKKKIENKKRRKVRQEKKKRWRKSFPILSGTI